MSLPSEMPINQYDQGRGEPGRSGPEDFEQEEDTRLLPPVLLQYWHTALRWRFVLGGIVGACLIAGVIVTILTAPLYTAKAEIEINRQQKKVTNVQGLDAAEQPQDLEFYATQYALLKSKSLVDRIAKNLKLADSVAFFEAHGQKMPAAPDERARLAAKLLSDHVSIDPIRASRLVDVTYTSRSPSLSAQIANVWVREFIDATTDREYSSTAQARGFLEARLSALRSKLEESEQKAVTYATANDIVSLETSRSSDGKTVSSRTLTSADLEQLNTALMSARADRISAEARARSGRPDITADALNNQSIGALKARRAEVASDYAKVLSQFEPGYPQARALKRQIDELDAAIAKDTARFGAERKQNYLEAVARERDLQTQVDRAKALFDKQNRATIQFNIYQRDADTNRQLYDGLLQRYKEIAEAGSVGASNIAVVDRAEAPNKPSSPKVLVNMALALLVGLGLSALTVVALEQIDEGIRGPSDVWKLLKLPLLGNVPLIKGSIDDALMDPKSSLTEAYLSIRSNLAFSTTHGLPRSLAITSSQPAEGKSTTSLAVATIIGRTGKSVVLVDGDLRSPSVHNLAGVGNTGGLSNLLTGDDNLLEYVQASKTKGLSVLSAGPLPPNPAELLSSDRLGIIIEQLLRHFDHIVIDAPPVLGLADAPLICRAVEGSVFVAEPGRSPLRGIRSALQRLQFGGAHLFGVIITKIDLDRQHYGYSYGYGYGYGRYGYGYGYSYGEQDESVGQ